MNYNDIEKLVKKFLSGDTTINGEHLKRTIDDLYDNGELTYKEARYLFKKVNDANLNLLTTFDKFRTGIDHLLSYYYKDYEETNYAYYDLDKKIELDLINEIVEKIDTGCKFNKKESLSFVSFLEELKKEHSLYSIIDSLDYMIEYIKNNTFSV